MSELSDGLRALADFLDTTPDATFTSISEPWTKVMVFVQRPEHLDSVRPLLDGLTPVFDYTFTTFTASFGPMSITFQVKTDLIAEKAEVGTQPVFRYRLKPSVSA